ncbi:L-type lectin-domain containing receptor kinase VII.1, partial [Linum perenne]
RRFHLQQIQLHRQLHHQPPPLRIRHRRVPNPHSHQLHRFHNRPRSLPAEDPHQTSKLLSYLSLLSFLHFRHGSVQDTLPGHGLVFLFIPFTGVADASSSQNLGFLNRTIDNDPNTHIFRVEFDVFANQEFNDIDDNHVGIDLNSLTSRFASLAGYWPDFGGGGFKPQKLNSGENYQVWIDYRDGSMNVTIAKAGTRRPRRHFLNVSVDFLEILRWSFSNSNFSFSEGLIATGLPSFVLASDSIVESKGFIAGLTVGSFVVLCLIWFDLVEEIGLIRDGEKGKVLAAAVRNVGCGKESGQR